MQFDFRNLILAALAPAGVAGALAAYAFAWNYLLPIHAVIHARNLHDVRLNESVQVSFDKAIDQSTVQVSVTQHAVLRGRPSELPTPVVATWSGDKLTIRPKTSWQPAASYTLSLGDAVQNTVHAQALRNWTAGFDSQPRVGVATFSVDGQKAAPNAAMRLHSLLGITFTQAMKTSSVSVTLDGRPVSGKWSAGNTVLTVAPDHLMPFSRVALAVAASGTAATGDLVTDPASAAFNVLGLVPSNSTSGITTGFKAIQPILVVVENSPPARPQSGLQNADIVYEYVSEYSITRMTAIYFNRPPNTDIGPVRSCRLINLYLPWAYSGVNLCSGASTGTEHMLFQKPFVPALQQPFAPQYFFRVGFNVIPHNLYTNGGLAERSRHQWPMPPPPYDVDAPHADNNLGTPAGLPSVPLHGVNYGYDPGARVYLRFDHGAPFTDRTTGRQLAVKNVVIVHVPFHVMGYVEDESGGGARSIWYDMLGSGAAEIYSDGRVIHATWHMGQPHQRWSDNRQPVYFTDEHGNFIELNTGLTWIHVVGNGQTS